VNAARLPTSGVELCAATSTLCKRAFDVVVATGALLACAVLLVAVAVLLRLHSPRSPALFRQRRVGKGGGEFTMWKFRTMVVDAEMRRADLLAASCDPNWLALDRDPRVTRIGRILRRTCIDEFPQLVNVLRGDMSLVGPRPLPAVENARAPEWAAARLSVRPGMTGPWQVLRGSRTSYLEMLRLDCRYVFERSLWGDVKLVARTLPSLIARRRAN
jgi:lipopolysaccharide/colanic/teichoic acid biosynthesis glycosyltransferase